METVYDIWKKDTAPYYEVVVVCSECYKRPRKCECEEPEDEDDNEL